MAAPPVPYLEKRRISGLVSGGTPVIEAARQTNNRKRIPDNNRDAHRNIDTLGRKTLATLGRWVYSNFGIPKGTLEEIADTVCDNICPQFKGADTEWGKRAEEYLKENDQISNVRGQPYTTQETERQIVLAAFRVGDIYILNTEGKDGAPQHQVIPSHRIGSGSPDTTVQGGPWDGAVIQDGVILSELLRPIAFRYLISDKGWMTGESIRLEVDTNDDGIPQQVRHFNRAGDLLFADISARSMHQSYMPEWEDQTRGYALLGASVFNWQDIREARAFDLINRKLVASRAVIEYTESGEAGAGNIMSDPDADRSDSDNNQTSLHNETIDGVTTTFMKARSGSRIEAVEDKRPTQEQQQFEETIIRSELHAIGWSFDFSYNPNNVKGAMARVVVARINRRAGSIRQRLVIPWRRRYDFFRLAKAIKNGVLPANDEWTKWGYSQHTPITADAKYDADVDVSLLRSGLTTRQRVADKRNYDWKDLDDQNEVETDRLLDGAKRIATKHGLTLEAAVKLMQEMNNGNSNPQFEAIPVETSTGEDGGSTSEPDEEQ
jgi:hypothetical protein